MSKSNVDRSAAIAGLFALIKRANARNDLNDLLEDEALAHRLNADLGFILETHQITNDCRMGRM